VTSSRLWVISDIHADVCEWKPPEPRPAHDVLIIAGDLREKLDRGVMDHLERLVGDAPLVYVPGNHDFYRSKTSKAKQVARERAAAVPGLHLLMDGDSVILHGVRYVGATLWTDYDICGEDRAWHAHTECQARMNDHRKITFSDAAQDLYRKWLVPDAAAEHDRHRAAIEAVLAEPFDGPTVVITHHAPHANSLRHGRVTELLDAAYASDLSSIMEGPNAPDLWVHGHVHRQQDYTVGRTRIVANPRGYITREGSLRHPRTEVENPNWIEDLVVEVGPKSR
jgi:predicted phosphodiesterase